MPSGDGGWLSKDDLEGLLRPLTGAAMILSVQGDEPFQAEGWMEWLEEYRVEYFLEIQDAKLIILRAVISHLEVGWKKRERTE